MNTERGFTLLEILVAFTIAAMALSVIYQVYGKGAQAVVRVEDYAQAVAVAESARALLEAGATDALGGTQDKYRWTATIEPHGEDDARLPLHAIAIDVSWRKRGRQQRINLKSIAWLSP